MRKSWHLSLWGCVVCGGSCATGWFAKAITANAGMVFAATFAAAVLGVVVGYPVMCEAVKA